MNPERFLGYFLRFFAVLACLFCGFVLYEGWVNDGVPHTEQALLNCMVAHVAYLALLGLSIFVWLVTKREEGQ